MSWGASKRKLDKESPWLRRTIPFASPARRSVSPYSEDASHTARSLASQEQSLRSTTCSVNVSRQGDALDSEQPEPKVSPPSCVSSAQSDLSKAELRMHLLSTADWAGLDIQFVPALREINREPTPVPQWPIHLHRDHTGKSDVFSLQHERNAPPETSTAESAQNRVQNVAATINNTPTKTLKCSNSTDCRSDLGRHSQSSHKQLQNDGEYLWFQPTSPPNVTNTQEPGVLRSSDDDDDPFRLNGLLGHSSGSKRKKLTLPKGTANEEEICSEWGSFSRTGRCSTSSSYSNDADNSQTKPYLYDGDSEDSSTDDVLFGDVEPLALRTATKILVPVADNPGQCNSQRYTSDLLCTTGEQVSWPNTSDRSDQFPPGSSSFRI